MKEIYFLLFIPRIFPQLIYQSTNELNKIQFMAIINALHISAPGYHLQEVFRPKNKSSTR